MKKKEIIPETHYDLLGNDNGEIMLLIDAASTEPINPSFQINEKDKTLELNRGTQTFILKSLKSKLLKELKNLKELYVCEIDDHNTEVVYAYTADIVPVQQSV